MNGKALAANAFVLDESIEAGGLRIIGKFVARRKDGSAQGETALPISQVLQQIALAGVYYFGLISIVRMAGKRLAGQTTTIDLIVLISLGVTLQNLTLPEGRMNSLVFICTVFSLHVGLARLSQRFPGLRRILREQPRPLIRHGRILPHALEDEGLTEEELLAALRRMGVDSPSQVRLAVLEETGHISAIRNDGKA